MGDDLWASRYILYRVAEDYGLVVNMDPKPMPVRSNSTRFFLDNLCFPHVGTFNAESENDSVTSLFPFHILNLRLGKKSYSAAEI